MSILLRHNLDPPPVSLRLRAWWVDSIQQCGRLDGKLRLNLQFQEPLMKWESEQPFDESVWSTITSSWTLASKYFLIVIIKSS